mgnify:CR=1 FL=1|tara:strand:- start:247 stop:612 length:366 start_codon:yes stop_codon:yes gene_type:complete
MTGAHVTLHFGLGMLLAMFITASRLRSDWTTEAHRSRSLGRWLLIAYLGGIYAAAPNLMYGIGVPESICNGWWMNIFLLHPLIDGVKPGGMLIGQFLLATAYLFQYVVALSALKNTPQDSP